MTEKIEFYDVKSKQKFSVDADKVKVVEKKGRFFGVTKSPSGPHECWKVLSKDTAAKLKKK
jgi:hypothetical protein